MFQLCRKVVVLQLSFFGLFASVFECILGSFGLPKRLVEGLLQLLGLAFLTRLVGSLIALLGRPNPEEEDGDGDLAEG